MKLFRWLRSVLVLICAVSGLFLVCLLVLFGVFCCRMPQAKVRRHSRWWGRLVAWCGGIKVKVEGGESLQKGEPYIFAANHQSQVDIPVLAGFLREDFCWMAKKELFQIPIFGRAMLATGFIPVDRGHGRKAMQSLIEAAESVAAGSSVIIFPEGTRSKDGQLQEFKSGAMVLAIKAGVPLVPVAVIGTHKILPKGKLLVQPGEVIIRVGEPIDTKLYGTKEKQELAQRLKGEVAALMAADSGADGAWLVKPGKFEI